MDAIDNYDSSVKRSICVLNEYQRIYKINVEEPFDPRIQLQKKIHYRLLSSRYVHLLSLLLEWYQEISTGCMGDISGDGSEMGVSAGTGVISGAGLLLMVSG